MNKYNVLIDTNIFDDDYFSVCPDCGNPIGIRNDGGNGFCADCALRH